MATIGSLVVRLGADIADFTSDLNRATALSKRNSAKMMRSFKRMGVGITAAMAVAVNEAVKFEKAMDEVSTLVGDTANMDALADSVRDVSREFGKAPVEEAKALYQIISSGAETAADQMALLNASNKLAIGGITDVATAADGLTGVLNAYGMGAENAGHISDIMFATMKAGKTTIGEIAASISDVTPIAAKMGVSFEEVGAALAAVTVITGNTATATTQLRQAITSIGAPAEKSKKLFDELGIQFGKTAIEDGGGLLKFFEDVIEKTGGSTIKLKKLLGSVEAMNGVLALATDGFGKFSDSLDATANATGNTDDAFNKMASGSAFQLDKLKVSVTLLLEEFGSRLLPIVNLVADGLLYLTEKTRTLKETFGLSAKAAKSFGDVLRSNDIEAFNRQIAENERTLADLRAEIAVLQPQLKKWIDQHGEANKEGKRWKENLDNIWGAVKLLNRQIIEAKKRQAALNKTNKDGVSTGNDLIAVVERTAVEIKALDDAYKSMAGNLDPLVALENEFNDTIDDLVTLLQAGRIDREQFDDWLEQITENFTDAQLSAMGFDTELNEIVVTAKKMKDVEQSVAGVAAVIENSFKRLDDTFADFWSNMVKNGKFSLKSIKDLFLDTIAQMLHAAITQPIVLKIGAALTGGLISGGAAAAGGSIFGGGGMAGSSGLAGIAGLFGGTGIGQAFASAPGALGNLMGAGAGVSNMMFGMAGIIGGVLGDKIFGGQGGIGGSLGAMIGTAILPGIGSIIGGLLGGALGGLFGARDPRISVGGTAGGVSGDASRSQQHGSLLGGFFIGNAAGGQGEFKAAAVEAITQFDNALATFMSESQLTKVSDALKSWSLTLKKEGVTIENILDSRFATILSTFSQNVQEYVNEFEGLALQTEALQRYVVALNTVGAAIAQFADSDIADILAQSLAEAAKTSTERLSDLGTALTDLFANFDGTPEQLNDISNMIAARYRGEIEYLLAIDQLVKGIAQSIEAQQNKIREAVEGPQSFTDIMGDAEALFASLATAGSPEQIASIVGGIQSLVDKAFGGLDAIDQAAQSDKLIGFLDVVQAAAEDRANVLAQMVIAEGEVLRDQALTFAESINAPMELNIQANVRSADALERIEESLGDSGNVGDIVDAIRGGFGDIQINIVMPDGGLVNV